MEMMGYVFFYALIFLILGGMILLGLDYFFNIHLIPWLK